MPNTLIWIPKRLVELGLVNVAARSPEAFIDYCEQDYAARVEHAAACVRESGAHVVMLTGPSASGKTTTAHKLADCIAAHGRRSAVVSLDNFYKDLKDYPRLPDGSVDYESVDALDISAINRCLLELIRTGRTHIPDFDFCGERRRHGVIPVEVGDGVVVIEGIHALNPRLTALLPEGSAFKIYAGMREEYSRDGQRILPTRDVRLARRMVRDHKFRGHSLEKTFSMWPAVCEGEDKNIKVFKPEADLLLDTSFSYEVCCLAPFVTALRGELAPGMPYAAQLESLCSRFALCMPLPEQSIPRTSLPPMTPAGGAGTRLFSWTGTPSAACALMRSSGCPRSRAGSVISPTTRTASARSCWSFRRSTTTTPPSTGIQPNDPKMNMPFRPDRTIQTKRT